jgi:flavin-dependent dehydrogenase
VAVIGASGPGLLAAWELARQGVPVHVYEQAERLDPAPRTLIVTTAIARCLGFMPDEATLHRIGAFELRSNGTLAHVPLRRADLIVERAALMRLLLARAEEAGARVLWGWRFQGLEVERGRTHAVVARRDADRELRLPVGSVIGADGALSSVARAVGCAPHRLVTNIQARVTLPAGADPSVSQVWFAPDDTRYFFWLIPESARTAVVGVAHDRAAAARGALDGFLRSHDLDPIAYEGARIPLYGPRARPSQRVGDTAVYLVGDAAAQVKVTTIGGTVTGFRGARAAAAAILRGSSYQGELSRLRRELDVHWTLRTLLNRFREEDYSALLRGLNHRVQALLHTRNRDHMAGGLWALIRGEPRLLLLAGRALAARG